MNKIKARNTRGFGLFESILAQKRAKKAESLILKKHRLGRVLDIGCGVFPHFLLSTKFKERYGLDSSVFSENFGKEKIIIKKMNVGQEKMPFNESFFDCVVMLAVFEHIKSEDLEFLLKDIKRVLKKEGRFVMTTPSPWSDKFLWGLSRIGLISKIEIDDHKHALTPQIIKDYHKKAGFRNVTNGFFELGMNMWFFSEK